MLTGVLNSNVTYKDFSNGRVAYVHISKELFGDMTNYYCILAPESSDKSDIKFLNALTSMLIQLSNFKSEYISKTDSYGFTVSGMHSGVVVLTRNLLREVVYLLKSDSFKENTLHDLDNYHVKRATQYFDMRVNTLAECLRMSLQGRK